MTQETAFFSAQSFPQRGLDEMEGLACRGSKLGYLIRPDRSVQQEGCR
jgi:hypothetical protein